MEPKVFPYVKKALLELYEQELLAHKPYRDDFLNLCRLRAEYPEPPSGLDSILRVVYGQGFLRVLLEARRRKQPILKVLPPHWHREDWLRELPVFYEQVYNFGERWKLPRRFWSFLCIGVLHEHKLFDIFAQKIESGAGTVLATNSPFAKTLKNEPKPELPPYSPLFETKTEYLEKCLRILQGYCDTRDAQFRALGYRREACSHWRDEAYLRRLAKQAFLRGVQGLSWGAIRRQLAREESFVERRSSLLRTTRRAIEVLELGEPPALHLG